jgi:hypothetical protein
MEEALTQQDARVDLLSDRPVVVNIGLVEFFNALMNQDVQAIHVDLLNGLL